MVADSLAAVAGAAVAAAGKPSGGYLKNHPMVAARKDYSCFTTLLVKYLFGLQDIAIIANYYEYVNR